MIAHRKVDDVICQNLNACLDVAHLRFEFRGRFHTICRILHVENIVESKLEWWQEAEQRDGATGQSQYLYVTMAVAFNLCTLLNSTFGSLEIAVNTRDHALYTHSIRQAFLFHRYRN